MSLKTTGISLFSATLMAPFLYIIIAITAYPFGDTEKWYREQEELIDPSELDSDKLEILIASADPLFSEGKNSYANLWNYVLTGRLNYPMSLPEKFSRAFYRKSDAGLTERVSVLFNTMIFNNDFSRDELFTLFLSKGHFGHMAYGIKSAGEFFFHKDYRELSSVEMMFLGLSSQGFHNSFIRYPERFIETAYSKAHYLRSRGLLKEETPRYLIKQWINAREKPIAVYCVFEPTPEEKLRREKAGEPPVEPGGYEVYPSGAVRKPKGKIIKKTGSESFSTEP